jgi:hypothetical protein
MLKISGKLKPERYLLFHHFLEVICIELLEARPEFPKS